MKKKIVIILTMLIGLTMLSADFKEDYNNMSKAYQGKDYLNTIKYGEQCLPEVDKLPKKNQLDLLFKLANSFLISKKELLKGVDYATQLVDKAKKFKEEENTPKYDKNFIVPGLKIKLFCYKGASKNDISLLNKAAETGIELLNYDKKRNSVNLIVSIAYTMHKEKMIGEAIDIMENICNMEDLKISPKYMNMLAGWYNNDKKNKEKAIEWFKKSYNIKKSPKIALNLGQLLYKTNIDEGIKYCAESYVLRGENKLTKAYKTLEHLVCNVKLKGKNKEEQDNALQNIISKAKANVQ